MVHFIKMVLENNRLESENLSDRIGHWTWMKILTVHGLCICCKVREVA